MLYMSLNIVYYTWINTKKNYKNIIGGQMDDILNSGISNVSNLYVVVVCEHEDLVESVIKIFSDKLNGKIKYFLELHENNYFEYYGIEKLYSLALLDPNSYFLYFHSKGMFNYDNIDNRHQYELTLTKGTLYLYKEVLELFKNNNNIMKIGLFPSNHHNKNFVWFNFFYARGTYLITCDKPIISTNRFYYEIWSESGDNTMGDVYNLYEQNYKKYELNEAGPILNKLNGDFYRPSKNEKN